MSSRSVHGLARRARRLSAAGVAALVLVGCRAAPGEAPITIRVASPFPRASIVAATARTFEEELSRSAGDRFEVHAFHGGSLVTAEEVLDAIGHGVVDVATGLWIYAPGRLPLGSFEYAFPFNDPDVRAQVGIKRAMFASNDAFREELERANVAPPLAFAALSPYLLLSREPIRSLDDLRGLRIGFTPVEYVPLFRAVGAIPILSPATEFHERLALGVVDGIAAPAEILHLFRLQELASSLLDIALNTPSTLGLWMNLDRWRRLSSADRAHLLDVGRRVEERCLELLEAEVARARRALREHGVRFTRLAARDLRRWAEAMPPLPRLWAERMERRGLPGRSIVEDYVARTEAAGWTFPSDPLDRSPSPRSAAVARSSAAAASPSSR